MNEPKQTRKAILTRLHGRLAEGCPIIGAGAARAFPPAPPRWAAWT